MKPHDSITGRDSIERVNVLISAASRAEDFSLRVLYVAEARTYVEAEAARLADARRLVVAQEIELARLATLRASA